MNSESFREEAATSSRADRRRKLFGHLFSGRYESLVVDGPGSGDLKSVRDSTNEKLQTKNGPSAYACIFNFAFFILNSPWSNWPAHLLAPSQRPAGLRVDRLLGDPFTCLAWPNCPPPRNYRTPNAWAK